MLILSMVVFIYYFPYNNNQSISYNSEKFYYQLSDKIKKTYFKIKYDHKNLYNKLIKTINNFIFRYNISSLNRIIL